MVVDKKIFKDDDGSVGWIEATYNSSNILGSIYFPKTETLYISFNAGYSYKYINVNNNIYSEFENSESQGKYFSSSMRKLQYSKEFKLFESEILEAKQKIEEWKNTNQQVTN